MLYEKLDYVIAIAEEQNLTRAAKKLYISQPTLTMYLNRLEESLGVQLFDRRKNPVLLTPAGKHYIEKMREIAEAEQILRGELRTVSDPARTFRIGSARVRGHYWLPPLLRLLSERHPETFFTVSLGAEKQLQKLLGKDSIDVAIGSLADIPESDIQIKILAEFHLLEIIRPVQDRFTGITLSQVIPGIRDRTIQIRFRDFQTVLEFFHRVRQHDTFRLVDIF